MAEEKKDNVIQLPPTIVRAGDVFKATPEEELRIKERRDEIEVQLEDIERQYGVKLDVKKKPSHVIHQVMNYMQDKYMFRNDVIGQRIMMSVDGGKAWNSFSHRELVNIKTELKLQNISIGRDELKDLIESCHVSADYNPIEDYIYNLPAWDRKTDHIRDYIGQLQLGDEEDRERLVTNFKKWFVAYIASLLDDGVVNHECFVLVGPQGAYKTTFLNGLVPSALKMDYLFSSKFNFENKDHFKYLATKMIINLDELSSFNRTDINILKSVLTDDRVIVRLPYKAYDVHLWRRASFVGNTNNDTFLTDETGNRRFLVHRITGITIDKKMDVSRLYAQALALFKDKFQYWYDGESIGTNEKANESFRHISIEEELVTRFLRVPTPEQMALNDYDLDNTTAINTKLVVKSDGKINVNDTTVRRLGQVMTKLGFKKVSKRINGRAVHVWAYKILSSGGYTSDDEMAAMADGDKPLGEFAASQEALPI